MVACLTCARAASAGLIATTVDGHSAHIDTGTGLIWLDFSNTYNLSPNTINTDLLPGRTFAGFQSATGAQLDQLFSDEGFPDIKATVRTSTRSHAEVVNATNFFQTLGEPDFYDPTIAPNIVLLHDLTKPAGSTAPRDLITLTLVSVNSAPGSFSGAGSHNDTTAFALVERPTPEPGTLLLAGTGALALILARRRWRRPVDDNRLVNLMAAGSWGDACRTGFQPVRVMPGTSPVGMEAIRGTPSSERPASAGW